MLFPWNLVSLHIFKRISLFLFLRGNSVLCSCFCIFFAHIWGEQHWFDFCLCFGFLWLSGKNSLQNTYRKPPSIAVNCHWGSTVFFPFLFCAKILAIRHMPCIFGSWRKGAQSSSQGEGDGASCGSERLHGGSGRQLRQEEKNKCKLSDSCCAISHSWGPAKLTVAHWYTFASQMPQHPFGKNNIA